MSFNPLADLLRYGTTIIGLVGSVIGFVVFAMMWRLSRNRAYFFLGAGFGLSLLSRAVYLLLMLSGGVQPWRSDLPGVLFHMLAPYTNLITNLLLITGFVMLGLRAIKTFKAPPGPPPLPGQNASPAG